MPSVDLIAVRNEGAGPPGPAFPGGAHHLVDANRRPRRAERLLGLAPGTAISLVVHIFLMIAGLAIWRAMLHDLTASEPIAVEIVHSIPGEDRAPDKPADKPKAPDADGKPPQPAPPKPSVLDDALPKPDAGGPAPPTPPTEPAKPAAPSPAPRQGSNAVEPPPEPKAAATQVDKVKANAATATPPTPRPPPPATPPPAPPVLTAPASDAVVPPPSSAGPDARPAAPAEPDPAAGPDPTAQLAAALPQNPLAMPSTFRAMLSGQGTGDGGQYKGAVFGMLNRGRAREVAVEAERRGLRGHVVVRFTLGDAGDIRDLSIIQSSGRQAVDAAAEAMVRGAAPFPPPPPGGQRVFTPALAFGS